MGGGGDIVMPAQPNYSEALGESLRAQVDLLRGTGDFDDTGGLRELVREYEAPLRRETAQIDTDVLRQTLLGGEEQVVLDEASGKYGIPGGQVVTNAEGDVLTASGGRYQMVQLNSGIEPQSMGLMGNKGDPNAYFPGVTPRFAIVDTETGGITSESGGELFLREGMSDITKGVAGQYFDQFKAGKPGSPSGTFIDSSKRGSPIRLPRFEGFSANDVKQNIDKDQSLLELGTQRASKEMNRLRDAIAEGNVSTKFDFTNPNIPADPSKAGQPGYDDKGRTLLQKGDVVRKGDGMIDLLGDRRQAIDPATGLPTERQAGFDEQGNFLGLSALAEDIQRGNLSRQREADLADVERLSPRFRDVMEAYKPETSESLGDARSLLRSAATRLGATPDATQVDKSQLAVLNRNLNDLEEDYQSTLSQYGPEAADAQRADAMARLEQRAADIGVTMDEVQAGPQAPTMQGMGGERTIDIPEGDTYGGDALGMVMRDVLVDQAPTLDAATTYNQSVDPLRQALLTQAQEGLNEGLTPRERSAIEQASRARQVASGRIFDPTATVQEAQAVIEGDRNRLMQNRAFAQSALGQEAGLQDRDLGRGLQQDQAQAGLDQQRNLAQAQIRQQAAQFGGESALRAALANQAQRQQAAQFDVGARLDAQTRDEELRQRGLLGYIDAVGRLAQIEDDFQLDPFSALLGRGGGGSLQAGQGVFGQAQYGLSSGPQYLNPESGLSYISNLASNQASMYGANVAADAARTAGLYQGLGSAVGGAFGMFNFGGGK